MKLTPGSSGLPYQADMQAPKSNNDQTAHISLQCLAMSKSKGNKTTQTAPLLNGAVQAIQSQIVPAIRLRFLPSRSTVPSFGEAVFTDHAADPQPQNDPKMT